MNWPTFEPLIDSSLWLALAAVGAVLLLWYARRRPPVVPVRRWWGIVALMAGALLAVLVVLLNPTWVQRVPPPAGKPVLTVLVDSTASMSTPDGGAGQSRFVVAADVARRAADQLSGRFELRIKAFADIVSAIDTTALAGRTPSAMTTDLAAGLAAAFDSDRPQGQAVLLLSDGIHNAPGGAARVLDALRVAKSMGVPVYTRTLGGDHSQQDLAVDVRSPQDLAFVGQKAPLNVRLRQTGGRGNARTSVLLLQDNREIQRQEVEIPAAASADVQFSVSHDKAGLYAYEVRALPLAGEVSHANNSAAYLLRVVDEPIRVLVLEGKPYWDSKFLLRTLGTDPAIALESVVKMAEGRYLRRAMAPPGVGPSTRSTTAPATAPAVAGAPPAGGAAKWRSESWKILTDASEVLGNLQQLRGYQVVVLGRDAEAFLTDTAVANLQNWIAQDGGSLVCYRGAPTAQVSQRLARLLPVKWSPTREARVRMRLTERGKDLQWAGGSMETAIARLPSLAVAQQVSTNKALAEVWATAVGAAGDEIPAVIYQPYGTGRVVVLEGAGMWRWAFLPPEAQQSEEIYGSLWHGLLRWLISGVGLLPGQKLALRTDKVTFDAGESASVTLLLRDEAAGASIPQVELVLPEGGGAARVVVPVPVGDEPGSYRANFGKLPEGRYQARVVGAPVDAPGARTAFSVKVLSDEQLNLVARPDLMKRIAEETGGAVLAAGDDVARIERLFEQHMDKVHPAAVHRTTAWDRWWVLLAVVGLWTCTWALRRSGGLV